jgi:WD40 repeat protein
VKLPHPAPVQSVAWSPKIGDTSVVAVGQVDGGIAIWRVDSTGFGKPEHCCLLWGHPGRQSAVTHLSFCPSGELLASCSKQADGEDALVNIWCLGSRSVVQTIVRSVSILP